MRRSILLALTLAAACGGDDSGKTVDAATHIDAAKTVDGHEAIDSSVPVDAAPATVVAVACGSSQPVATVTTPNDGFAYVSAPAGSASNNSEIHVNDVVEFSPGATHPVGPDATSGMTDPGLVAPASANTCLKFTEAGTFHYKCTVHGFKGTVTVAP